jgi:hypothetical protein
MASCPPITVGELRSEIAASSTSSKIPREKFAADYGGLSPREAFDVVIANAHLFHPTKR